MKCRICGAPAFVKLAAHNATFCAEHFDAFFLRQVRRTIERFGMLEPDRPVLVAVSGGKDSLAVTHALNRLGYPVEALHINLGIATGGFSAASLELTEKFCRENGVPLHLYSLEGEFGRGVEALERGRRPFRSRSICSLCGMTKRHIMNEVALARGAAAVATGHNLDDMATALLANVLRWDGFYLAKTLPVLASEHGFARKIKPLALLSEEEILAYCRLHGIARVEGRCPFARDAKFLRYKALLNDIEQHSPGTKRAFYEGYLGYASLFRDHRQGRSGAPRPCGVCGLPTSSEVCTFCRLWRGAAPAAKPEEG
ncbi:MAG: ATP-binding protein [Desulfotomaculales bacterium]